MDDKTAIAIFRDYIDGDDEECAYAHSDFLEAQAHAIQAIEALAKVRAKIAELRAQAAATEYPGLAWQYDQQADRLAEAIGDKL